MYYFYVINRKDEEVCFRSEKEILLFVFCYVL